MKLTERSNGLYLEDVVQKDIRFSNLAGRLTGSPYENPDKPQHVLVLWLDDPECLDYFRNAGVIVKERVNETDETVRYSVQLKAYPKMRVNRVTGEDEQYPKVVLRTTSNKVRLEAKSFGLVDSAHVNSIDIRLHIYENTYGRKSMIPVIDELWCTVDEGAGEIDESYLEDKYGFENEVPFA